MGGVCSYVGGAAVILIKRNLVPYGKMALTVGDWLVEAESLLEKKSVNEAVDLLNRIGK